MTTMSKETAEYFYSDLAATFPNMSIIILADTLPYPHENNIPQKMQAVAVTHKYMEEDDELFVLVSPI